MTIYNYALVWLWFCRSCRIQDENKEVVMIVNYQDNQNISGRRSVPDRRVFANPNYMGVERRVSGDRRKGKDKRKHKRYRAKEGAYAAIRSGYDVIGMIKDISQSGLAFQYIANGKRINGVLTIDIFHNNRDFYLKDVPFKTTSDFNVDSKVPFSTIMLRQCGGQFNITTDNQRSQLDLFLLNHTSII